MSEIDVVAYANRIWIELELGMLGFSCICAYLNVSWFEIIKSYIFGDLGQFSCKLYVLAYVMGKTMVLDNGMVYVWLEGSKGQSIIGGWI